MRRYIGEMKSEGEGTGRGVRDKGLAMRREGRGKRKET